jgi:hypothetical protein
MINRHRLMSRLLSVAALLAVVVGAPSALAQDDEEEEAPAPAVVNRVNRLVVNELQIDQWIFGNMGVANSSLARNMLDSLLTLNVDDVDRCCGLTPVQKKKLLLAGRGDIKRFFDRVDEVRKKYTNDKNFNFQNQFQQIWQEIQPLQTTYNSGVFGADSIYAKSIRTTLTSEQAEKHEKVVRGRTHYRYWARVDLALELLNNEVGFTDDQRRKLLTLLREETVPPRQMGRNDYYVVLYQISRIPEAKLRPVFEDFQWGVFKRQLEQGRRMENFLKQNGFVPGEESDVKKKAT